MIWLSPCTRSVKYCTYICRVYILHYNGMFIRLTLPLFGAIGIGEIMVWLRRYIVQWEGYSLLMIVCESMFWADKSPEELCWLTKLLLFLAGSACLITSFCSVFLFFFNVLFIGFPLIPPLVAIVFLPSCKSRTQCPQHAYPEPKLLLIRPALVSPLIDSFN